MTFVPVKPAVAALAWSLFSAPVMADSLTVFATSSTTTAMAEIEAGFESATGHDLIVSLAGSSALARQIQLGAPADIFISANPDWMNVLDEGGLLAPGTRFDLLGNALVLIAAGRDAAPVQVGPDMDLAGLLGDGRLAMAMVDSVPGGMYGKAALSSLGQWDKVAPQVAQADNVRAAMAFVATGEAPFGIVFATDAAASDSVTVVGSFPAETHPPIVYPVAVLANRDTPTATAFMDYLRSPEARAVFARQGFTVLAE